MLCLVNSTLGHRGTLMTSQSEQDDIAKHITTVIRHYRENVSLPWIQTA
jgi:hypothetical protein